MTNNQMIIHQAMATPGFKLIMTRLDSLAQAMKDDYDKINFVTEPDRAMHIQVTRDVILKTIPTIMEGIMNEDKPDVKWSFRAWLRSITTLALVLISTSSMGAGGPLEFDGNRVPVQGAAPNGIYSAIMTVGSATVDLSKDVWWGVYAPSSGCKFRLTPTSAKGAYPQFTVPDGQLFGFVVNKNTPFLNLSGCTSAERYRQRQ